MSASEVPRRQPAACRYCTNTFLTQLPGHNCPQDHRCDLHPEGCRRGPAPPGCAYCGSSDVFIRRAHPHMSGNAQ